MKLSRAGRESGSSSSQFISTRFCTTRSASGRGDRNQYHAMCCRKQNCADPAKFPETTGNFPGTTKKPEFLLCELTKSQRDQVKSSSLFAGSMRFAQYAQGIAAPEIAELRFGIA